MNPWRWWKLKRAKPYPIPYRWSELARYNTDRAHGIRHTPEWDERMAIEQAKFNKEAGLR